MTNILIAGAIAAGGNVTLHPTDAPKFFRKRNSSPRVKNFAEIIEETS